MTWLKKFIDEKLAKLPKDAFVDRTFGLGHIERVVDIIEKALKDHAEEKKEANRASLMASARDPNPEGKGYTTFTSMAADFWQTDMTFPRVARNAMLIAIYSQMEWALLSCCISLAVDKTAAKKAVRKRKNGEITPHRYLRYLRDDLGFSLGDFTQWPEWQGIDGYCQARNCLAHNGGIVDDKDDAEKIAKLTQISVDESGLLAREPIVHLLPGACEAAAETAKSFVGRLAAIIESGGVA